MSDQATVGDLVVEWWPIERVKPYERNPRKIPPSAVEKVAASLRAFGWRQPIVVNEDGVILVGHTRRLAAQSLGMERVPVHIAAGLTAAEQKAYRVADNRTGQEATWELELLGVELKELKDLRAVELTGFDANELHRLLCSPTNAEDVVPNLPPQPVSRLGDLWSCGEHRVLCGDSTDAATVAILLGGQKAPFLMVTDPPYGVEYDPEWRDHYAPYASFAGNGSLGKRARGKVTADDRADWSAALEHFPGSVLYLWSSDRRAADSVVSIVTAGFVVRNQIVWVKQHFVFGRGSYHSQHEPCWYAVRKGHSAHWHGDQSQSTYWQVQNLNPMGGNKDETPTGHSTQKPVELFRRPILNHTTPGEAVYDPFLGSGTCLVAAEVTGRICYGVEIEPRYVDVIVQRWQNLTGKAALLMSDNSTFTEIAQERAALEAVA